MMSFYGSVASINVVFCNCKYYAICNTISYTFWNFFMRMIGIFFRFLLIEMQNEHQNLEKKSMNNLIIIYHSYWTIPHHELNNNFFFNFHKYIKIIFLLRSLIHLWKTNSCLKNATLTIYILHVYLWKKTLV